MTEPRIRALVVDDHHLLAQSLSSPLEMEGLSCLVADLSDRDELVRSVTDSPPDLVLLDLDLGGAIGNGSTLVAAFVAAGCRVLVVSGTTDREQICRAVKLGAIGVVSKGAPFPQLLEAASPPYTARRCCPAPSDAGCSARCVGNATVAPRCWHPSTA